nr:olfactory receptor 5 [Gregopimpla kuwanae]
MFKNSKNMASSDLSDTLAIKLTRFFMRFTGFWIWDDKRGKILMQMAMVYTIVATVFAWIVTATDLWFSRQSFYQLAYAACNSMTINIILLKLIVFLIHREAFLNLIQFSYKNFWQRKYDTFGQSILQDCESRCTYFVCTFTFFAQSTVCSYTIQPIIENYGKNETDRILPFNIYIDFPITTTPFFEITFFVEIMSMYHSGICYFCFDNLLCIMIVHATGQFRILQKRFEMVYDSCENYELTEQTNGLSKGSEKYSKSPETTGAQYNEFKACVRYHQSLIRFTEMVEDVYTLVILSQVVIFSLLICLVSYQAALAEGTLMRRIIFMVHTAGTLTQTFMFTLTCDDLKRESGAIAESAYHAQWYCRLSSRERRTHCKDFIFVMMRARRPCCLTAGGFFPVSLETFTTILSTSMSYLTLLRQGSMQ